MLMKISVGAQLALRAALQFDGRVRTTRDLAGDLRCSAAHLSKVLQRMQKHRLLEAIRGPRGGYRLAVQRDQLRVGQVLEAIDGKMVLAPEGCELGPVERLLGRLHNDLVGKLGMRVADLA